MKVVHLKYELESHFKYGSWFSWLLGFDPSWYRASTLLDTCLCLVWRHDVYIGRALLLNLLENGAMSVLDIWIFKYRTWYSLYIVYLIYLLCSIMLPMAWERSLGESEGSEPIVFAPLSYMLSDSCFYRRECSRGCMKLAIGDGDFESLKEDHICI